MLRQNVLDLPPRGKGVWPEPKFRLNPLPGRVHLISMKVPEAQGGILMTDRERHSCDVAAVTASGVPELPPGTVCLLMAGVGVYLDDRLEERLLGTGDWKDGRPDPWDYCIPARVEGFHWVLSPGWCWARAERASSLIETPERLKRYRVYAQHILGYEGEAPLLTEDEIKAHGWELFTMKRPGGWERHLVLTG